jgi:hypothetical protein
MEVAMAAGRGWVVLGLGISLLLLPGCDGTAPHTSIGQSGPIAAGQAFTWANVDADSSVRELGVTVPLQALAAIGDGFTLALALPPEVQAATPLRSVLIELKQRPILPKIYQVPRLDVRFFTMAAADLQAIDCMSEPMPASDALPAPYVISSTAAEPAGTCVQGIGVHANDSSAPELVPDDHVAFQHALFLGYHGGRIIFVNPTEPIDLAIVGKRFDLPVPRPADLADGVLWPARSMAVTNVSTTVLSFSLGQLQAR